MRTCVNIFGKIYGWAGIFEVDIHLTSGTVQRHDFYCFNQKGESYQWKSPLSLQFKNGGMVAGWFLHRIKKKFYWGKDADFWNLDA